jgi:hypothetical protein
MVQSGFCEGIRLFRNPSYANSKTFENVSTGKRETTHETFLFSYERKF